MVALALSHTRDQSKSRMAGMSQMTSLVQAPEGRQACSVPRSLSFQPSLLAGPAKSCPQWFFHHLETHLGYPRTHEVHPVIRSK